jgi:hypothetical protein
LPHRVHVDIVGLRSEVILIAREAVADRNDGFPALFEVADLGGDVLQLAQAAARKLIEVENDGLDAVVVTRSAQRVDDVAHERLAQRRSLSSRESAIERVTRELIDERAARRDEERGTLRYQDALADGGGEQQQEDAEQEDQVQQAPQAIQTPPDDRDDSHGQRAIVTVHSLVPTKIVTD